MPRVKASKGKLEYIQTFLKRRGGDPITCNNCGYTGDADLIESTALGSGFLERCPVCKSKNFSYKDSVMPWITDEWKGCYPSSWKGMIVPGAMSHPAKFSSKLIRRIYEHLRAEKWVKEGDKVIDPFGGVALGSLDAMRLGLEWFGVELELKFVDLGKHNISNWEAKYHNMPKWGRAVLCQGDSRKLLQVLRGNSNAAATRSSPPYAETDLGGGAGILSRDAKMRETHGMTVENHNYGKEEGNLGNMKGDNFEASISSPPFADSLDRGGVDAGARRRAARELGISNSEHISPIDMEKRGERNQEYGSTPGQLSAMTAGDFEASISSPPFIEASADGGWQMLDKYAKEGKLTVKQAKGDPNKSYPSWSQGRDTSYGESDGQLGNMPAGDFNAAAMRSSPPFGNNDSAHAQSLEARGDKSAEWLKENTGWKTGYGDSDGQLADMNMDEGFSAAISSAPFRHSEGGTPEPKPGGSIDEKLYARHAAGNSAAEGYGGSDGQLANMGEGDFDQAVSSPPYNLPMSQTHNGKRGGARGTTPSEEGAFVKYGNTDGQLEGMESSDQTFEAAMKSPPYEGDVVKARSSHLEVERTKAKGMDRTPGMTGDVLAQEQYGESEGQLGNDSGDDFWMAARQIVEQVYLALAPGGHAVWVTKAFVKNKQLVPFDDQWRQLCEAVGFITLHEHRALLTKDDGSYSTLDGGIIHKEKKYASFFRRLAEKNGSPKIGWETVWCMMKPENALIVENH